MVAASFKVKADAELASALGVKGIECSFCVRSSVTIKQVMETYKDQVRIVFKQLPLPFHQYAQKAAEAALCAKEQGKFWKYHDKLFESQI